MSLSLRDVASLSLSSNWDLAVLWQLKSKTVVFTPEIRRGAASNVLGLRVTISWTYATNEGPILWLCVEI